LIRLILLMTSVFFTSCVVTQDPGLENHNNGVTVEPTQPKISIKRFNEPVPATFDTLRYIDLQMNDSIINWNEVDKVTFSGEGNKSKITFYNDDGLGNENVRLLVDAGDKFIKLSIFNKNGEVSVRSIPILERN